MVGVNDAAGAETGAPAPGAVVITGGYRAYALWLLTAVFTVNFLDRQILSILDEPIKQDMRLSDFQIGILGGASFAAFYTTFGILLAAWADRGVRRNLIAWTLGLFSLMTIFSGLAANFLQLLAARIGVGIGEAGTSPAAHSIISDLYPPERRATAMGIYGLGLSFGVLLGILAGGWVYEYGKGTIDEPWRLAFFVAGAPGLILALMVRFTLKEPPRGYSDPDLAPERAPRMTAIFRFLWSQRSFRHIALGATCVSFAGYGTIQFFDNFLIRSHGMTVGEVAGIIALFNGVLAAIGTYLCGRLADRLGRRNVRWNMWVPAIAFTVSIPFVYGFYFLPDLKLALAAAAVPIFFSLAYLPPSLAMVQALVPLRMRSMASAVLFFIINLLGLGLGPPAVGGVSYLLEPHLGDESIRWALALVAPPALAASAIFFTLASRHLKQDLAKVHAGRGP